MWSKALTLYVYCLELTAYALIIQFYELDPWEMGWGTAFFYESGGSRMIS